MKAEQTVWVSFRRAAHLSSAIVRASSCLPASVESKQRLTRAAFLSFLLFLSPPKPTPPVLSGNKGALLLRWCISFLRLLLAEVGLFPDRPDTGAGLVSPPISGDAYAAVPPMRTPREWLAAGVPTGSVAAEMRI
jgi:hypothetical protein